MTSRRSLRILALSALGYAPALLWVACGGGGEGLIEPQVGSLEVSATTSGPEPDADGYTVTIDAAAGQPIGPNATVRIDGLAGGAHTVALSGAAANCSIVGEVSAAVDIVPGGTATVGFSVTCRAATGSLEVTTSTGSNPDPDGYTLLLNGVERQPIGTSALVLLAGLAPGEHSVGLGGLAANCRVEGDNPRPASVVAGETVAIGITVTCDAPPPTTGTLQVTTATGGADLDPDGFRFSVDDGQEQPIGANATASVAGVAAGAHSVRLVGAAANCSLEGENPRPVVVPVGGTADVSFAVTCTAASGRLRVRAATTGSPRDPDGYDVNVDGAATQPLAGNGNTVFDGLGVGDHQVTLGDVAASCQVQGDNPRTVAVTADATSETVFQVQCAPTTGELTVTVSGLPAGVDAAVTVSGPNGFTEDLTETGTLEALAPGEYTISAASVTSGGDEYRASPETQTATVSLGETAPARVSYARVGGTSLNLRIAGLYLSQSTQTLSRGVPLVENRGGFLRVFAVANEANTVQPTIRVRLFRNGTPSQTFTLSTSQGSTPTGIEEGPLTRSWNVAVPGSLIRRGLEITAEVDPDGSVAESDEADNVFPASGRLALDVRTAERLQIVLVPIRQRANGLEGNVTTANMGRFLDLTQRVHPLPGHDAQVHQVYTTSTDKPLDPNNADGAWSEILNEVLLLQTAEGRNRNYYGVVRINHGSGLAGLGYVGAPAAIGYDDPADGSRVMAHELGHNWGRLHSDCGNPGGVDPEYPYPDGTIGVFGLDVAGAALKNPQLPDVMGHCGNPWISDFTYEGVLDFRSEAPAAGSADGARPGLLVWGRIENGRAILEPAFQVTARPSLPRAPGPYSVQGYSADGARLFDLSFAPLPVADDPRRGSHFAFAVPLDRSIGARLATLRLTGPGVLTTASSRSATLRAPAPDEALGIAQAAGGAALEWNASAYPMIMVRDPDTGEVLSLARGGRAEVRTGGRALSLVVSDGVRSRETRLAVPGR